VVRWRSGFEGKGEEGNWARPQDWKRPEQRRRVSREAGKVENVLNT